MSDIVRRGQIEDEFEGFDEDAIFCLTDGTYWIQAEYKYWYHYAYRPAVEIFRDAGALHIRIAGRSESVRVRQLSGVIESQIVGAFEGWQGDSEYQLANGQVWKQREYKYEYKYEYQPKVVIYEGSSGTTMDVGGSRAVVQRVR